MCDFIISFLWELNDDHFHLKMIQTQVSINHTGVLLCESYRSNVSFCFSSFSYLAYFNLASAIVRIDAPTETHNIGRD